jgi:hypothetical protein
MSLNDVVLCSAVRVPMGATGAVVSTRPCHAMQRDHLTRSTALAAQRMG